MKIVALTTCFNRVEKTLQSIKDLKSQNLPSDTELSIIIVDDASTDRTAQRVKESFPDVEIIEGGGNLYWAGGMRYGWEKSVKYKEFDALLVFNDDIRLYEGALKSLLKISVEHEQDLYAITGAFESCNGGQTYGGFKRASSWHPLRFQQVLVNGEIQEVETLNMNFALISKKVIDTIGFLEKYFLHGGADVEFGLRLRKNGGKVFLTPNIIGHCESNSLQGTSLENNIGYIVRIRRLLSIKEQPLKQRFYYYKNYAGFFWFFLFLLPYIRTIFRFK